MGYRIERPLFLRASDLGAPHRRERVFILAHASRAEERIEPRRRAWENGTATAWAWDAGEAVDDASSAGYQGGEGGHYRSSRRSLDVAHAARGGAVLAYADEGRRRTWERDLHAGEPDTHRSSAGLWPPGPDDDWSGIPEELWPSRPKSCFRRDLARLSPRLDRLRALGNAVVPLASGAAFAILAEGAGLVKR